MKEAVFITGFNNWGKTTIIQELFNNRQRFYNGWSYQIPGVNSDFTVETHSNDDWWGIDWADKVNERLKREVSPNLNLFTANVSS